MKKKKLEQIKDIAYQLNIILSGTYATKPVGNQRSIDKLPESKHEVVLYDLKNLYEEIKGEPYCPK